jgi:hypothetical protein
MSRIAALETGAFNNADEKRAMLGEALAAGAVLANPAQALFPARAAKLYIGVSPLQETM